MLHADRKGAGPRVVFLHGFTQTGRSWTPVAGELASTHEVVMVDLPGHGESPALDADLWRTAEMVGDLGGRADYVGYSMGGRVLLHLALRRPELIRRMVLVGATGGIDDAVERRARRDADEELARAVERDGVDAFLDRWLAGPLFAGLPADAAGVGDRRRNTAQGLASSLRRCGTGTQDPLWDRLPALGAAGLPVAVVVGEHDRKFAELGGRLVSTVGSTARLAVVAGAGHAAHLEQPQRFLDILRPFLAEPTPG